MLQHPTASLLLLEPLLWAVQRPRDSWFPAGLGIDRAGMGDVTPMSSTTQLPAVPHAQHPSQLSPALCHHHWTGGDEPSTCP